MMIRFWGFITIFIFSTFSYGQDQYEGCLNESITRVPYSECVALVDLYTSTNGEQWNNNTNWLNFEISVEDWHGIQLRSDEGDCTNYPWSLPVCFVRNILMNNNNLQGEIPDSLANLTKLGRIFLNDNNISGTIPNFIGDYDPMYFYVLSLANNNLTGQIPDNLGNLYLNTLNLSGNNLTGQIPVSIMQNPFLHDLRLENNYLNGSVPADLFENFGTMPSVYFHQFTGQTYAEIISKHIHLRNNCLDDLTPSAVLEMISVDDLDFKFYEQGNAEYCGQMSEGEFNFDLNGDGVVNLSDYLIFLANYGSTNSIADFNGDGVVGILDLLIFISGWHQDSGDPLSGGGLPLVDSKYTDNLMLPVFDSKGNRVIPDNIKKMMPLTESKDEIKIVKYPKQK